MTGRWVKVYHWEGNPPAVGDQLRSRRGRYLITGVDLEGVTLRRLRVFAVKPGSVDGGTVHPWTWKRRGRSVTR